MRKYYIAGIVKEEDGSGYSVYFPDVPNVCAGGSSVEEAIDNAMDGLYVGLRGMAEDREAIPVPSDMETAKAKLRAARIMDDLPCPDDVIYQYIPAPELDMTPVRVNITVPKGVLAEIDSHARLCGMTRSGFLVAAAQAYPG